MVGVTDSLAYHGIDMIIGNDLADRVEPNYPIIGKLAKIDPCEGIDNNETVFPACVVTRAQAKAVQSKPVSKPETIRGLPCKEFENVSREVLVREQELDPQLKHYFDQCIRGDKKIGGQSFHVENDVLVRKWCPRDRKALDHETETQIVLPQVFKSKIMRLAHDVPLGGHMGSKATINRVKKIFFWPNMTRDIIEWVKSCKTCQVSGKPGTNIRKAPLKPLPIVHTPFSKIQIDCVGPVPRSSAGHEYMLTIICLSTRYPEAIPLGSIRGDKIVDELVKFFSRFGWPTVIQSDNGSNFKGNLFENFCNQNGIKHVTSVPYHPESQGAVERYHQSLKAMLNTCATENPKSWHTLLPQLLYCSRTTIHTSLGFSPAELVFGHEMRGPLEVIKGRYLNENPKASVLDYINKMKENYHRIQSLAKKHMEVSKALMKVNYDKGKKDRNYQVGDEVLVFLPTEKNLFQAKFEGPFQITEKLSNLDYRIATPSRRKASRIVHVNQIKSFVRRDQDAEAAPLQDQKAKVAPTNQPNSAVIGAIVTNEEELVDLNRFKDAEIPSPKLKNSEIMNDLDSKLKDVPTSMRSELKNLLQSHQSVFKDTLGRAKVKPVHIRLKQGASPTFQHPYRYNPQKMQAIEKDTQYLIENDLAVPHIGEWSSPPVVVPKESGEWRVCQDYRRVNKLIESDAFPLPRILDCIDQVGEARYLSKLDLLKGFYQIPLAEDAQNVLAFSTHKGLFRYKVLPFGVKIAPTAFQRVMNQVIQGLDGVRCYIDDIVIFSNTWEEHLEALNKVLERFMLHNLVVNLNKSEFCQAEVTYLGHRVGSGKIKPKNANISAIQHMRPPTTVRGVRRFLGATGFYRRFCPNFSKIANPLTELLRKNRKFKWTDECENSFRSLSP